MISSFIDALDLLITFPFDVQHGLVDMHQDGEKEYPGKVMSQGSRQRILDIDSNESMCYHRLLDPVSSEDVTLEYLDSRYEYTSWNYPIRFVFYVLRSSLSAEYNGSEHEAIDQLSRLIWNDIDFGRNKSLANQFKLNKTHIGFTSNNLKPFELWQDEYVGVPYGKPDGWLMGHIDYSLTLEGRNDCFWAGLTPV